MLVNYARAVREPPCLRLGPSSRVPTDSCVDAGSEDFKQPQSVELPIQVHQQHTALAPPKLHAPALMARQRSY